MKKLLVAIDGSDHARKALDLAADIAKAEQSEVLILHVVSYVPMPHDLSQYVAAESMPLDHEAYYESGREFGDKLTNEAANLLRKQGLEMVRPMMLEGNVASTILTAAEDEEVDAIFVGCRGLSDVKGLMLGSVSHRVANLAPCTCVTVK